MTYTTHGLMTPEDLAEVQRDYDTARDAHCPGHYQDPLGTTYCSIADDCPGDECPACGGPLASDGVCADDTCDFDDYAEQVKQPAAPMDTYARLHLYQTQNGCAGLTSAQRRRLIKKAGRDPEYVITRTDSGMGYPRSHHGYKELAIMPRPVSGAPY